jgi:YidC/Oxa1 family membrane protein insertase
MNDNKNTILAIVLSALVLIAWQFFFAMPQDKARQEQLQQQQLAQKQNPQRLEPLRSPVRPPRRPLARP